MGEIPMTGGKPGNKQNEKIVQMVSKHWTTYSTIFNYTSTYMHQFEILTYI